MPVSMTSLDTRDDSRSRMDMDADWASGMELYSRIWGRGGGRAGRRGGWVRRLARGWAFQVCYTLARTSFALSGAVRLHLLAP